MAERYPAFRAGQKVTGSLLASMQPLTVRKVSDTARTSDTNSDDPELQITVEANAVYTMTGTLFAIATNATTDINIAFTVPVGSDGSWSGVGLAVAAAGDTADARMVGQVFNGGSREWGVTSASAAAPNVIHMDGTLITGSTAGTVAVSWACGAVSGTLTLQTDSFFILKRIA